MRWKTWTRFTNPGAVILSGGPKSTTDADAPDIDFEWLQSLNVPVLGVCYGMQLLNIKHGGTVKASNKREYGPAALLPETCAGLYRDMSPSSQVWMSHSDTVDHLAEGCRVIARNAEGVPVSLQWGETTFGIQFHPEVTHSMKGAPSCATSFPVRPILKSSTSETLKGNSSGKSGNA